MDLQKRIREYFLETIGLVFGINSSQFSVAAWPLGESIEYKNHKILLDIVRDITEGKEHGSEFDTLRRLWKDIPLAQKLIGEFEEAFTIFYRYYSIETRYRRLESSIKKIKSTNEKEKRAKLISEIWLPELQIHEEEILPRWKLSNLEKNPRPFTPTEITLQLNALYTLPEKIPDFVSPELKELGRRVQQKPGKKIADYDHPVVLFEVDERHELIQCLEELNDDLSFEKSRAVVPREFKLLITISISVTHENLDTVCEKWIREILRGKTYQNIRCLLLSTTNLRRIKQGSLGADIPPFSVSGKYAKHFNALKYMQLLLEKAYGLRAGFKLDTDEGIRSRDLFLVTGKTWLQTLCHPYWGGKAKDWRGRMVDLDVNIGEYINSNDIEKHGYAASMRTPDAKMPRSFIGPELFFQKSFVVGKTVALYNRFNSLEDGVSHPVVKGGGLGISNDGLRRAYPFALSRVGRAEDQQFYFSGIARGIRGIFHPDLRIAHYKSSVSTSENRTKTSRFIGDLYRLIVFREIAAILEVKEDIDPMPGIFAGELARCQAFFHLLYNAHGYYTAGDEESGDTLLHKGMNELRELKNAIDEGVIRRELADELEAWRSFVSIVDSLDREKVHAELETMII